MTAASVLALGLASTVATAAEPAPAPGAFSDITITAAEDILPGGPNDLAPGAYGDIVIVEADTVSSTGGVERQRRRPRRRQYEYARSAR